MSQTKAGIKKIKENYGKDHFNKIGKMGGNPMLLKIREEKLNKNTAVTSGGIVEVVNDGIIINSL